MPCRGLFAVILEEIKTLHEEETSPVALDHDGVGHLGHALAHLNLRKVLVPGRRLEGPLAWPGECQALARGGREERLRLVRVPRQQGRGHLAPKVLITLGHQGPQARQGGRRGELELT